MRGDLYALDRRRGSADRTVSALAVAVVAAGIDLTAGLTVGFILAVVLAPVWLGHVRRYRWVALLFVTLGVATLSGLWLTASSASDHLMTTRQIVQSTVVVLTIVGGVGLLVWARSMWQTWQVALFFGIGTLAGISTGGNFAVNPWRFGFSLPVVLIVLSLAAGSRRRWLEFVLCLVLVGVTAISGGRSRTGILLVVAVLLMWQMWRPARRSAASALRLLVVVGSVGLAILQFIQSLALEGFLGESAAERTNLQIAQSGSLLLGGRPEVAATAALMRDHFSGFGLGVSPNYQDILVAKAGFRAINYDPDNGYVEKYLFGTTFELHSVIGDMWAWMGIAGIVAACAISAVILLGITQRVVRREAAGVALFAAVSMLWNLCFSPLNSSLPLMIVALALLPYEKDTRIPPEPQADRSLDLRSVAPHASTVRSGNGR